MGVPKMCAIGWLLMSAAGYESAAAQTRPRTLRIVNVHPAEANIKNASVTPQPLQFLATDPDVGSVPAAAPATVSWQITGAHTTGTWKLSVNAAASAFSGCGTVPISAVTVRCASAGIDGHRGSGACGGPFQLSNLPQMVALGRQGNGNAWFTVIVNFTFQDGWQYIAATSSPCTLNLNYVIDAS
jgi:hypothetical protein